MHLGHKRANSFSSTKSKNKDLLQVEAKLLPPPPVLLQRSRINTCSTNLTPSKSTTHFERRTDERRSFTGHFSSETTLRASSSPYKGVTIPRATPATIRFSVNPDIEDWLCDMSRPRSPSKNWKNGANDAGVPALDQALAAIKDQLVSGNIVRL